MAATHDSVPAQSASSGASTHQHEGAFALAGWHWGDDAHPPNEDLCPVTGRWSICKNVRPWRMGNQVEGLGQRIRTKSPKKAALNHLFYKP